MARPSNYIGRKRPRHWRELLLAMRDGQIDPPRGDDALRSLLDDARRNELGPHVAHALMRAGDERSPVLELHQAAQDRIDVMLAAAGDVADVLAGAGIPVLALKNVGIAKGIYPCSACTPMGDIDLLIDRDAFFEAHSLLVKHGLKHDTRSPDVEPADIDHGYESGGSEYRHGDGESEVWIELQWRPVAGRWIQPHQEPRASDLIARSRPISGSSLRLLDPTDNMLQVALHTAKHSYCRAPGLRLHTDVHRLAVHDAPDWDALSSMAQQLEVTTAVFFSLDIAQALLGSPIPSDVLQDLQPTAAQSSIIRALLRRTSVFEPHQQKFTRPEMMLLHALMYDAPKPFLASALDSAPEDLRLDNILMLTRRGYDRTRDLVSRYQA